MFSDSSDGRTSSVDTKNVFCFNYDREEQRPPPPIPTMSLPTVSLPYPYIPDFNDRYTFEPEEIPKLTAICAGTISSLDKPFDEELLGFAKKSIEFYNAREGSKLKFVELEMVNKWSVCCPGSTYYMTIKVKDDDNADSLFTFQAVYYRSLGGSKDKVRKCYIFDPQHPPPCVDPMVSLGRGRVLGDIATKCLDVFNSREGTNFVLLGIEDFDWGSDSKPICRMEMKAMKKPDCFGKSNPRLTFHAKYRRATDNVNGKVLACEIVEYVERFPTSPLPAHRFPLGLK